MTFPLQKMFLNARRHRRLVVNGQIYWLERITFGASSFLVAAMLARFLGPGGSGKFIYAQSIVQFAAPLLASGMEPVVVRELVRQQGLHDQVLANAFLVIVFLTLAAIALPISYIYLQGGKNTEIILAIILSLSFLFNGLMVLEHYFKSQANAYYAVLPRLISTAGSLAFKAAAIVSGSLTLLAWAFVLESSLLGLGYVRFGRISGLILFKWRAVHRGIVVSLLTACFPNILAAMVILLFFRFNFLALGWFSPVEEVGRFGVGFSIVQLVGILPQAISSAIYPSMVREYNEDRVKFYCSLRHFNRYMVMFGYASLIIGAITSRYLVAFAFGPAFYESNIVILILLGSAHFNILGSSRALLINASGIPRYHVYNSIIGLTVLVPLTFLLIPRYGAVGAALSSLGGCVASGLIATFMLKATRSFAFTQMKSLVFL